MDYSQAYAELLGRTNSRSLQEGSRPYPVPAMEIMLLDHARQKAQLREVEVFRQLVEIFDWNLSRRQVNQYVKALKMGLTIVLTDLTRTVLWTSHSFLAMTGYAPGEVLGNSPKMLQGKDTDDRVVARIRQQLDRAQPVQADILNYRKGGESYKCRVAIDPIYNHQNELTHFLAVEGEVRKA